MFIESLVSERKLKIEMKINSEHSFKLATLQTNSIRKTEHFFNIVTATTI